MSSRGRRDIDLLDLQYALNSTIPKLTLQIDGDFGDEGVVCRKILPICTLLGRSKGRIEIELNDGVAVDFCEVETLVEEAWEFQIRDDGVEAGKQIFDEGLDAWVGG